MPARRSGGRALAVKFAQTHGAEQARFALDDHPAVRRWLGRVKRLPGLVALA